MLSHRLDSTVPDNYVSDNYARVKVAFCIFLSACFEKIKYVIYDRPLLREFITTFVIDVSKAFANK